MIKLKDLLLIEKTLYHGTTIDNAQQIEKQGLIPQSGEFVSNAYGGDYDEAEIDLPDLTFATDKENLKNAITAATQHVANKLKKSFHDITDEEFIHNGAIIKIIDGEKYYKYRPKGDENYYGQHPGTVEPGDYYSDDVIFPDEILTGNKLLKLLKRYGLWPRGYMFTNTEKSSKEKRNVLIKYLIKKYPDKPKDYLIKYIMDMDRKTIENSFDKIRRNV